MHGSAPPGFQDHHAVERGSIGRAGVTEKMVFHTRNTFRIPTLIHLAVSAHFSRKPWDHSDLTVRQYMRTRSFDEQHRYALKIMRRKGALK